MPFSTNAATEDPTFFHAQLAPSSMTVNLDATGQKMLNVDTGADPLHPSNLDLSIHLESVGYNNYFYIYSFLNTPKLVMKFVKHH